MVSLLG